MKFIFKARTAENIIEEGTVEAADKDSAIAHLQQKGFTPLEVRKEGTNFTFAKRIEEMTTHVSVKDILLFFREFSTLVSAKVPIAPALKTIYEH